MAANVSQSFRYRNLLPGYDELASLFDGGE